MSMETRDGSSTTLALLPCSYAPLPGDAEAAVIAAVGRTRRTSGPLCAAILLASAAVLLTVAALAGVRLANQLPATGVVMSSHPMEVDVAPVSASSRGHESGVSEKTSGAAAHGGMLGADASGNAFPWSNAMLQWQRTGFHFQPEKNWMNDPNGPVYYKGWYHLFYQYNPDGAIWGNKIAWGHAASRDLLRWRHLPVAMSPDQWYDINGVWSGSATVLPDGRIMMLYTGSTNTSVQVQCLAFPTDPSDPLLINWTKYENNPVMYPPPGIGEKDFRDPTTAWFDGSDDTWRLVIGSKDDRHAGMVMTYKTKDFIDYELVPGLLHRVPGTGMWECIDLYPVEGARGIDMTDAVAVASTNGGEGVLHVMKESSDDDRHDYYALGRYDAAKNTWTPLDADADVGIGLRYDWGKFYASKTFYDPAKKRRVLWGWVGETDSERADVAKGWASLQSIPRTVVLDTKTGTNLLQSEAEDEKKLRIPVIFQGDLAQIAASHLQENDLVYVSGQLTGHVPPFKHTDVQANIQVIANLLLFVDGKAVERNVMLDEEEGLMEIAEAEKKVAQTKPISKYPARTFTGAGLPFNYIDDQTRNNFCTWLAAELAGSNRLPESAFLRLRVALQPFSSRCSSYSPNFFFSLFVVCLRWLLWC